MANRKSAKSPITALALPKATNPNGVKPIYINNMDFTLSSLDAHLLFNEISPDGSGGLSVERRAIVVMTLPHLVAIAQVLQAHLPKVLEVLKAQDAALTAATKNDTEG